MLKRKNTENRRQNLVLSPAEGTEDGLSSVASAKSERQPVLRSFSEEGKTDDRKRKAEDGIVMGRALRILRKTRSMLKVFFAKQSQFVKKSSECKACCYRWL